jgi:hypothetical protein
LIRGKVFGVFVQSHKNRQPVQEAAGMKTILPMDSLEGKLRSQLELPRVESRPRSAYGAARSNTAIAKVPGHGQAGDKVRRAVYGKHFVNVGVVENIEAIQGKIQHLLLAQVDCP